MHGVRNKKIARQWELSIKCIMKEFEIFVLKYWFITAIKYLPSENSFLARRYHVQSNTLMVHNIFVKYRICFFFLNVYLHMKGFCLLCKYFIHGFEGKMTIELTRLSMCLVRRANQVSFICISPVEDPALVIDEAILTMSGGS